MANHLITVADAATMISSFTSQSEDLLTTGMRGIDTLPKCETFARKAFDMILEDPNCAGVRIYLGLDGDSKVRLIAVGVNSTDDDIMIPSTHPSNESGVDCVIEDGMRCPPYCPPSSLLNS